MSASPPTWKRHDTYPPYQAFLEQAGGASVIPLGAASQVKLILQTTGKQQVGTPTAAVITGIMSIASAAQGYVTYNWATNDLAIADLYNAEYEIAWSAGGIETVPNDAYDQIVVVADLENS